MNMNCLQVGEAQYDWEKRQSGLWLGVNVENRCEELRFFLHVAKRGEVWQWRAAVYGETITDWQGEFDHYILACRDARQWAYQKFLIDRPDIPKE